MKAQNVRRNHSMEWSFGFHAGIIMLALLPFAQKAGRAPEIMEYILEIGYRDIPETRMAGSSGLQARSTVYHDEPEPATSRPDEAPVPVAENEPAEEVLLAENHEMIESDISSDADIDIDIAATAHSGNGSDPETHAGSGGSGSPVYGDQNGAAIDGEGGAGEGLEGDGIISRRVVYRENIGAIARVNGRITFDICIDREGRVISASYDPVKTTIDDAVLIKEATDLVIKYRFERNYNAPKRECGQMTFIFTIR